MNGRAAAAAAKRHALLQGFRVGQDVAIHPASDWWMRGEKFGVVVGVGRIWISVKLNRTGTLVKFHPRNLEAA